MSEPYAADETQVVANVLAETSATGHTRNGLLKKVATSAAAGAAAGGIGGPLLSMVNAGAADAAVPTIHKTGTIAITAEALAVTYLKSVVHKAEQQNVFNASTRTILKAANAAEWDHYKFLKGAGFRPLTTKFWIPDEFYGTKLANVPATLEVAETLFVNAYLKAISVFARRGQPVLARYAGATCAVEAQPLALARSLQGKLPNNIGFAAYTLHHFNSIVAALEHAGVGFGKKGTKPGSFHNFTGPDHALVPIKHNVPT
jgi:hypothetical protein